MRFRLALLVVLAAAGITAAEDQIDTSNLRLRFDEAVTAFKKGDTRGARAGFEEVSQALAPRFTAGQIVPNSSDQAWVLYGSSVLLLSDLHRYKLEAPNEALAIETNLASEAERLGYVDLAAAEWLAVGDIQRFDLKNDAAALEAYRKVPALTANGRAADSVLVNQALQAIARSKGGDRTVLGQVRHDVPLSREHIEAVSLVLPHVEAYRRSKGEPYVPFAEAHPRSFRAAVTDYAGFLLVVVFRGDETAQVAKAADSCVARHSDDLVALTVREQMVAFHERAGRKEKASEERRKIDQLKRKLGVATKATPATQSGTPHASAFERTPYSRCAAAAPLSRQEVCLITVRPTCG